ncbi:hypothetical protein SKAU_G00044880 [Synaphobranchus kaupii]|uniref:Uncharacterized protein n=1 Tax=Synaphobranchus kaupii TaxID=118154 RepID=A0A9Q1J8U7_SYNKA|nr:hypothetical protein SKAU_G00044880 [Synaphobranchus kaupii]
MGQATGRSPRRSPAPPATLNRLAPRIRSARGGEGRGSESDYSVSPAQNSCSFTRRTERAQIFHFCPSGRIKPPHRFPALNRLVKERELLSGLVKRLDEKCSVTVSQALMISVLKARWPPGAPALLHLTGRLRDSPEVATATGMALVEESWWQ